ncbi:MAG: substrate-binding domain-containing protein [Ignavibacteria bacterium]|nr:substrate-binding domain-containing protein [Ignavibacteria bacterium]
MRTTRTHLKNLCHSRTSLSGVQNALSGFPLKTSGNDSWCFKSVFEMACSLLALSFILLVSGCAPEKSETATRGNLHVLIAESTAPAMVEQVNQFLSIYAKNGANITYEVVSSEQAIRRLLRDSVRFIITTRPLTSAERQQMPVVEGFDLNEVLVAYDGIAVVTHHKNPVEQLTTIELTKILSGEIKQWNQLSHPEGMKGTIELLFEDSSDVTSFIDGRILHGQPVRKDAERTGSSLQTLRLLVERPRSIGLVGGTWIDSARVPAKVLNIAETRQITDTTYRVPPGAFGKFYSPHPANVYRTFYPLKRGIYVYTFCPVGSLASGFGAFVANKDGQRLLLNRNIVPGTQPIRLKVPQ